MLSCKQLQSACLPEVWTQQWLNQTATVALALLDLFKTFHPNIDVFDMMLAVLEYQPFDTELQEPLASMPCSASCIADLP